LFADALAFDFHHVEGVGIVGGQRVAAFSAVWIVLAGLFSMLPVSSGAAAVGLLGAWLLTSFALPSLLVHMANQRQPMPSRLAAIASMRAIQQQTEVDSDALLRAWYRDHPVAAPASVSVHRFPIAMVPRYLEQDRLYRPLQARFDQARSAQFEALAGWSWSSPGLALIMGADVLAGIDAPRYQRYLQAVDGFEDRWRAHLVPVMMGYRQLDAQELARLPEFVMPAEQSDTVWSFTLQRLLQMAGLAAVGAAILLALRKRFAQP
jgi:ABC-2 type transport system permease protein